MIFKVTNINKFCHWRGDPARVEQLGPLEAGKVSTWVLKQLLFGEL